MIDLEQLRKKIEEHLSKSAESSSKKTLKQLSTDIFFTPKVELELKKKSIKIHNAVKKNEEKFKRNYICIGVDSSQIYPSKHEGVDVAIFYNAAVIFDYSRTPATFDVIHETTILFPEEAEDLLGEINFYSKELIDVLRQIEELKFSASVARKFHNKKNVLILLDASLSLATLISLPKLEELFLEAFSSLKSLKNSRIVSYISSPKTKELLTCLKNALCLKKYFDREKCAGECTSNFCSGQLKVDADLPWSKEFCDLFFEKESLLFCFKNFGQEVCKLEGINNSIEESLSIIKDQVEIGQGYPLALTEAHVACSISKFEKEAVYKLIEKNVEEKISQKQRLKKSFFG